MIPLIQCLKVFFRDLNEQVVFPTVPNGATLNPRRTVKGGRRGPILKIAEHHQLFNYIESMEYRQAKLNHVYGTLEIVRGGETITLTDGTGAQINGAYLTDGNGACRFNFRKAVYSGRAGIKGRGKGHRDAKKSCLERRDFGALHRTS